MPGVLDILDRGDLCTPVLVILLLLWLGDHVADKGHRGCGRYLSILAFLVYGACAALGRPPRNGEDLLGITVRSLLAAGLVLGGSWVVLPVICMLYEHTVARLLQ